MKPAPKSEWYDTIIRVKPGVRILGIISMDNDKPREFFARMFVLDESEYGADGFFSSFYSRDKLKKGLAQLKKIKNWHDLASSDYFDFALDQRYYYANDPDRGSPTMEHAYAQLIPAMKKLAREWK